MPTVDIYSKQQVDALIVGAGGLPDPASASVGDVLTLDSNKDPAWVAPSGGQTVLSASTRSDLIDLIVNNPNALITLNVQEGNTVGHFQLKFNAYYTLSGSTYNMKLCTTGPGSASDGTSFYIFSIGGFAKNTTTTLTLNISRVYLNPYADYVMNGSDATTQTINVSDIKIVI